MYSFLNYLQYLQNRTKLTEQNKTYRTELQHTEHTELLHTSIFYNVKKT